MEEKQTLIPAFKIFDKYDTSEIVINDLGLQNSINLSPSLVVKSQGRNTGKYGQAKVHIMERLANRLSTAGHRGKKHKIGFGHVTGKYNKMMNIVLETFDAIEKRTNQNPVQVFVKAIENSAPRDEITMIEYGGARYPQSVDVSPLRRVNLSIRWLVQGASDKAFGKKKSIVQGLTDELIMAYEGNGESFAVRKKTESEKQADSAR